MEKVNKPFLAILEQIPTGDWESITSLSFLNEKQEFNQVPDRPRIVNLDEIPSPYLTGIFDPLMKANPNQIWLGLWKTNRGYPFSCTFCEWGAATKSKIYMFGEERVYKEINWYSQNKIEFIFCCDANFGIKSRDIEIAQYMAQNKKKYGYPKAFSIQNTKNSSERSYDIQKILGDSGLNKGVNLALQSANPETPEGIKRKNIKGSAYRELQNRFAKDQIETFTDMILALPNETYETFLQGIAKTIEEGQHNKIQFINLSILPNTAMGNPDYQKKYGFVVRDTDIVNIYGSVYVSNGIYEKQRLVIATNTMPKKDWIKTRVFSWMISLIYFDKLLQIPLMLLHKICDLSLEIKLSYNIWDIYQSIKIGDNIPMEKGEFWYRIDRTTESWESWEEWGQKVVWYGNKRAVYIYDCTSIKASKSLELIPSL